MKYILFFSLILLSSCATLITNNGFKSYVSPITKTAKYKALNSYQKDLIYLNDLCENSFPDIEAAFPDAHRSYILDSLFTLLASDTVTDNQFNGYARYYLSHFNNEHTSIYGLESTVLFPYILYPVADEWYLWDIHTAYDSSSIGKKVVALGGRPMTQIERLLSYYVSEENPINEKHSISRFLNRADLLHQLGILTQSDSVQLEFTDGSFITITSLTNESDVVFTLGENRFQPHPVTKYRNHNYDISLYPDKRYAYMQFNRCYDQVDTYESMRDYLKPWVIPFAKGYLNRQVKKKNTAKIKGYIDVERPIFKDYLQLMFDSIQASELEYLIIDLRHNAGGSSLLCLQLLYHLTGSTDLVDFSQYYYTSQYNSQLKKAEHKQFVADYESTHGKPPVSNTLYPNGFLYGDSTIFSHIENPKSPYHIPKSRTVFNGQVIVLANQGTGSAAALFTTLLQDNGIATIIGTSVGNNPIGATNFSPFTLAETKMSGSVATGYLVRPKKEAGYIQVPDFWVENGVAEMAQGKDLLFDKAMGLINKKR